MIHNNIEDMVAEYITTKSPVLRDAIVAQHAQMVERIARRHATTNEPADDLTQEGFVGLLKALDNYDPYKGVKFTTYATHLIVGEIKHYFRDRGKIIKEPAWLQELWQKVNKIALSLTQTNGRQPTPGEIALAMDVPEEQIIEVIATREIFKVSSLDSTEDDNETDWGFDSDKICECDDNLMQIPLEEKMVLDTAVRQLKEIEQKVINLFYYDGFNQTEIANNLGISCNYVSHILRNSVQKLRRILTTEELRDKQLQSKSTPRINDITVVDEQTGVYSHEYMRVRLEEELLRAGRYNMPLAFVIIRFEGLNEFREFYGDMTVTEFMKQASGVIKSFVRKSDVVSRASEWEFGLIMPHTDSLASAPAERLKTKLNAWCKSLFNTSKCSINVDTSQAIYPSEGVSVKRLIQEARLKLSEHEEQLSA